MAKYKLIAGVDDAGRGPVIGPLVIAGVAVPESRLAALANLGVRDSKTLSPRVRRRLASLIRHLATRVSVRVVDPETIDKAVMRVSYKGLNHLEAAYVAEVIGEMRPHVAYVDSPDIRPERFRATVLKLLPAELRGLKLVCENKADQRYAVVAAASIIAKEVREEEVRRLKAEFGDFGSGYPADPRTVRFLREYYRRWGDLPPIVRRTWGTVRKLLSGGLA